MSRRAKLYTREASEGRGGATARGEEKEKKEETFGEGRERRKEEGGGTRQGRARGGAGRARASERACGAGPGGAGPRRSSFGGGCRDPGAALSLAAAVLLRAGRLPSSGHVRAALAARPGLLASPALATLAAPHLAPAPGSGCARGPPQSWGCSPWSSATATSTARGSGRGSVPTKRSWRGPTSSSKSSSRTARTSSPRPKVSGALGRGQQEPLPEGHRPSCAWGRQPEDRGIHPAPRGPGVIPPRLPGQPGASPFPAPASARRPEPGAMRVSLPPARPRSPGRAPSVPAFSAGPAGGQVLLPPRAALSRLKHINFTGLVS